MVRFLVLSAGGLRFLVVDLADPAIRIGGSEVETVEMVRLNVLLLLV
jgi:hypothetical protein